jgi:hypothetical protein
MPKQHKRLVKYEEGQWFAVPLRNGGFALGIIVRGNFKTKGVLGYFFGPKYEEIPTGEETISKNKDNALLIGRFGDLGIIEGEWSLIQNGKPFNREEWPVPLFHRVLPFPEGKAVIVEYRQDYSGSESPMKETVVPLTDEVTELPDAGLYGSGAVEITLTKLLSGGS